MKKLLIHLLMFCVASALSLTVAAQPVGSDASGADALGAYVQDLLAKQQTTLKATVGQKPWRIEVVLGQLDPRLKLAPCSKVQPFMPAGSPMWGRTRVGLRCEQGPVRWSVFWPVTVKVWGEALVPVTPLRPGVPVVAADFRLAEVDLAEKTSPAVMQLSEVVERTVLRQVEPGQSVRQDDFKARRWFAAGDPVQLKVRGAGFAVAAEGTALTHGDEGQCARIRMDNGRIVCAQPVAERVAELIL